MSCLVYRWLLLYGLTLFVFKGCESLFLRHTQSGECIAAGSQISNTNNSRRYWAEMVNNCLNVSAQFRYLDTELLQNIKTGGTLVSKNKNKKLRNHLFVHYGKREQAKRFQNSSVHRMKQTDAGSLFLYDKTVNSCAQPNGRYVDLKKDGCSDVRYQKFTFGSVTQYVYGTTMKDVRCSPKQYVMVKRADYGDFNKTGFFNDENIDTTCSKLTNCQVKSLCDGKRSCELTMDNNLLPSEYCREASKQIYIEYICVDRKRSTIITAAPNIRLWSSTYEGYIQIYDGSSWRYVEDKNWDKNRQKMLCQHLGFDKTDASDINTGLFGSGLLIATGDLICYNTQASGMSCCTHLVPSTTTTNVRISKVICKVCDKPILKDVTTFPDFSGSGSSNYRNARFSASGWCASGSTPYLLIDLKKEYHITRVVVMGNKDQTKWSGSYLMRYSHDKTYKNRQKINGNKNGYRASTTRVNISNVRYIKIQSNQSQNFCLRIELCGEAQIPAAVEDIKIQASYTSARVTWKLPNSASASSYITQLVIYLNGTKYKTISRRTQTNIEGLDLFTSYEVEIETRDGSLRKSIKVFKSFKTRVTGTVTNYGTTMSNVRCSPQHIVVKRAVYGDFNQKGVSAGSARIDPKCNVLTNCQVKSRCGGKKSCKLVINQNLLPSQYCSGTQKEIYTEYACVDTYHSTTITEPKIRLTSSYKGYLQIKEGSTWIYVKDENWDVKREKMLCQHLGFKETDAKDPETFWFGSGYKIAIGDLICYNTQPSGTSCCVHLVPSIASSNVPIPFARCKICDDGPLLEGIHHTSPNKVFSGSGGSNDYDNARFTRRGWCPSSSGSYLSLDLQKEYHITRVVVMGDSDQTKWSVSYSMRYSHNKTLVDTSLAIQVNGNQNGYQASTTDVVIYNVRYIKIQSTENTDFCLRIELCGEVQTPAPVNYIKVTPSNTSAQVTLGNPAPETSSYITHYYIKLNDHYLKTIRRQESRTAFSITGLTPFTKYTVRIFAGDGSSQWSSSRYKIFTTNTAVPSEAPGSVAFTKRSKEQLTVSWSAPSRNSQNGELTGYRVCYSHKANSNNQSCSPKNAQSYTAQISDLRPATKYFVTVAARTAAGYGPKSEEINKITNGERVNPVATSYSSLNINLTKPATYIKEVMIIVKDAPKNRRVEEIGRSDLKPYHADTKDPYVTAYLKADVLPLTFVIGDGKEYNSEKEKYSNQPLKQNSSYIAFLRFFESQDSYYSTMWSNVVKTLVKSPVPSGSPWNVTITKRSKNELTVSWRASDQSLPTDELTGYKVCYSDKAGSSNPICSQENDQSYTIVIKNLRPATKYFVTVAYGTSGGYGPNSAEISKITSGECVNPVATSYSSLNLTIMKPATYIKEVMIIVKVAPKNRKVEEIGKSDLKPYQANTKDPYIAAYLKADVLPLTFVIGDGKEYHSKQEKYFNQLLEHNSNYIVFLRFFENQDSYYSTEWSSAVKTMVKPGLSGPPLNVAFNSRGKTSLQVSWKAPEESFQNVELTGYQVCFYTRDTAPECLVFASSKVLSLTLDNLKPSTKYFVTVSISTTAGFGEKSLEVSKITSGEPVNPLTTSYYTLSLNIPKPAEYIREVMVIVQLVTSSQTPSGNIKTSELKPYQTNTQDPYITAYLKPDVLPLTFVIGDGKEYNSEKEKYFNQPLDQKSSYLVFLRYFESQDSYYSTEWSNSVKTMTKRPVEFLSDSETSEQSSENNNTRLDLIIPLVILSLCLLLSLAVIVYQRRRFQNNNRKKSHKLVTLRQADQTGRFDSTPEPENSKKSMEVIELTGERVSYVNDDTVYETPDDVIESIERIEAESKHAFSTEEESSAYISWTDNKEPENFYQPLQTLGTSFSST